MGTRELANASFTSPGQYSLTFALRMPQVRVASVHTGGARARWPAQRVALRLRMENEHGQVYWDTAAFEYNTDAVSALQWFVLVPCALLTLGVTAFGGALSGMR